MISTYSLPSYVVAAKVAITQVLSGKMPFYQYKDAQVVRALMKEEIPLRPNREPGTFTSEELNDDVWNLLVRCWNFVPQDRPSCRAIRDAIRALGAQDDDRPDTMADMGASVFWRAMREKSKERLDYERVQEVLLRVVSIHVICPSTIRRLIIGYHYL